MTDRQSLYPNRITFTDEETNQVYTGTWEFADQPSVNGTLMNKAAFLTDATATALGLSQSDPTVNDALAALASHKSRHAAGGSDALTPADIGAASASELSSYIPNSQKGVASGVATLGSNGRITPAQAMSSFGSISASKTISDTDMGKVLTTDSSITFTLPSSGVTNGIELEIWNLGSGTVTLSGALFVSGHGDATSATIDAYSVAGIKRMSPKWYITGGVSA